MRVIRCKNSLTVVMSGGRIIQTNECTDELFEKIKQYQTEDNEFEAINLLIPESTDEYTENVRLIKFWQEEEQSSELTRKGDSVYWESVSTLSMPMEFAERVMKAEKNKNKDELEAYRNFWTLLSLNPDKAVRENLFKFLEKWGMVITKSGLVVGYRNVAHKSGESDDVFTDEYTHTFTITIGKMVTMPREKVDSNSDRECSSGLHCGGTSWLKQGYYGSVGLACLINPIDICAVPWAHAEYGKLRTCAYLPIAKVEYDETGHVIPFRTDSGFEEPFVPTILYDGVMATEESATYKIPIPKEMDNCLYDHQSIPDKILSIARKYMKEENDN